MNNLKEINRALQIIRRRYNGLIVNFTRQAVLYSMLQDALRVNEFEIAAGLVVDLWESCEKASQEKRV